MVKKRKILISISFDPYQLESLDILAKDEGGSIAEHVRKALDEYLAKKGFKKD